MTSSFRLDEDMDGIIDLGMVAIENRPAGSSTITVWLGQGASMNMNKVVLPVILLTLLAGMRLSAQNYNLDNKLYSHNHR